MNAHAERALEVSVSESNSLSKQNRGRRDFLKASGAVTAALLAPPAFASAPKTALPALPSNPRTPAAMPTRNLGKTGYKVGIFSLGGQATLITVEGKGHQEAAEFFHSQPLLDFMIRHAR